MLRLINRSLVTRKHSRNGLAGTKKPMLRHQAGCLRSWYAYTLRTASVLIKARAHAVLTRASWRRGARVTAAIALQAAFAVRGEPAREV